jgi:nitrate reductase delta subunit
MAMVWSRARSLETLEAIERLRGWTRDRFRLPEEAVVSVMQVECSQPGCPPLETVVAFWSAPGVRHQFKLFKTVTEAAEDDLPPWWMKNAIIAGEDDISCC